MILSWIWVYWATQLLKYRWHLFSNFYRRCQNSKMTQQAHSHWLASSFVQFSPYCNRMQSFLGDTIEGTVYPEDILCGGMQYPRILYVWGYKNQGCQISYDTGISHGTSWTRDSRTFTLSQWLGFSDIPLDLGPWDLTLPIQLEHLRCPGMSCPGMSQQIVSY